MPESKTFQSTPSVWRETFFVFFCAFFGNHFNPLPPYGGRPIAHCAVKLVVNFNPLPPYGGRLETYHSVTDAVAFQSTPSVWRETDIDSDEEEGKNISIHSLRMEGDLVYTPFRGNRAYFNPLPPYGGRPSRLRGQPWHDHFNPLPPYGGRPSSNLQLRASPVHFNPLPPYGGRRRSSLV